MKKNLFVIIGIFLIIIAMISYIYYNYQKISILANQKNIEYLDEIFKVLGNKYSYEFVEVPQIINA